MHRQLRIASAVVGAIACIVPASAQELVAVPEDTPLEVGPGTQGLPAYVGPIDTDFYFLCAPGVPIGEIAEDVHMRQAGDLASFTYRYFTSGGPSTGSVTAIINVYPNDASNSILPTPGGEIASYTVAGLPFSPFTTIFEETFDVPMPIAVSKDLWIGVKLLLPAGAVGSLAGAGAFGTDPTVRYGTTANVMWLGPSSCTLPGGELVDFGTAFGIVASYNLTVRVFPEVTCEFPIPNGDFEDLPLFDHWALTGTHWILSGFDAQTPPTSGNLLARIDSGGVSASALASFLGVSQATLDSLTTGGPVVTGSGLRQSFTVAAGDTLAFDWNFLTDESTPDSTYNDLGLVVLSDGTSEPLADTFFAPFFPAQVGNSFVGNPLAEETGWQHYERTFAAPATITLGLGVANKGDGAVLSALALDCVELVPGEPDNEPPTCSPDLTLARASFLEPVPGSFVVTEGETIVVPFEATDPDGDLLMVSVSGLPSGAMSAPTSGVAPLVSTFSWTPSASDKAGAPYVVTVTFQDPSGEATSCELTIADVNLRPVCSASDQTLECTGPSGAAVTLDGSATDADDPAASLIYAWFVSDASVVLDDPTSPTPSGTFPVGVTMATLTVADGRGGVSVCDVLITVEDTMAPEVMCTTDVAALWPPNHGMRPVHLIVTATDVCTDPSEILPISVHVSSDEPDDASGNGDGNTTGDVNGLDGQAAPVDVTTTFAYDALLGQWVGTIFLRAERGGAGNGRKYTIDVSATDSTGNAATTSCCVVVPHDRRHAN